MLIAGIFIFTIIVMYTIFMVLLKRRIRANAGDQFDLSVATFKPRINSGSYSIKLTHIGTDYDACLKTVNRYTKENLQTIEVNQIVVANISVYTAEDLIYELKYIGADGEIVSV